MGLVLPWGGEGFWKIRASLDGGDWGHHGIYWRRRGIVRPHTGRLTQWRLVRPERQQRPQPTLSHSCCDTLDHGPSRHQVTPARLNKHLAKFDISWLLGTCKIRRQVVQIPSAARNSGGWGGC